MVMQNPRKGLKELELVALRIIRSYVLQNPRKGLKVIILGPNGPGGPRNRPQNPRKGLKVELYLSLVDHGLSPRRTRERD